MGADIHTMAEVRYKSEDRDFWSAITAHIFPHEYFNPKRPLSEYNEPYRSEPYTGRNYRVFGFLANVRNGRGFAGIDTGESVTPILGFENPTRGVPKDASTEWKEYVEAWGLDLHSTSWLTLRELKEADWDRRTIERGVINAHEYERIRASQFKEHPNNWSGGISGGGVRVVSPEEYEALRIEKGWTGPEAHPVGGYPLASHPGGGPSYYVNWQWESTMREYAGTFLASLANLELVAPRIGDLPKDVMQLIQRGDLEDPRPIDADGVRMMMGFDN